MRSATATCSTASTCASSVASAVDGVDQRDHAVEPERLHEHRMRHDRLQHGGRIGEARGLDDDAVQPADRPVCSRSTRSASVSTSSPRTVQQRQPSDKLDDAVGGLLDEQMVDRDIAELVDDDGRVGERRILEQPVEQRRLAGAEESGQHRDRDGTRSASALSRPPGRLRGSIALRRRARSAATGAWSAAAG